jgi:hypothetical protein
VQHDMLHSLLLPNQHSRQGRVRQARARLLLHERQSILGLRACLTYVTLKHATLGCLAWIELGNC